MESLQNLYILLFIVFLFINLHCLVLKRELIRQRERFINTLLHDFKVPLLAQSNSLKLLCNKENAELITDIDFAYKNTLDMIDIFSENLKFENYDYKPQRQYLDLNTDFIKILEDLTIMADEKNIDFYYQFPNNAKLYVDANLFTKTLKNLTQLAINFAHYNDKIYFYLYKNDKELNFIINYNQSKNPEHKFSDIGNYLNFKFHSIGENLKLDFCKKIIKAHGGKLKIKFCEKKLQTLLITIPNSYKEKNINKYLYLNFCNNI
ncbi:HAMP domain-containing histidine kinase [bacterium]|nr:HAMP domain-containing histidine kinase [bacterium]